MIMIMAILSFEVNYEAFDYSYYYSRVKYYVLRKKKNLLVSASVDYDIVVVVVVVVVVLIAEHFEVVDVVDVVDTDVVVDVVVDAVMDVYWTMLMVSSS